MLLPTKDFPWGKKLTNEYNRLAKLINDADEVLTENIFGPGEKRKSGGVARGGTISQKLDPRSRSRAGSTTGTGGSAGGTPREPQAQSGEPNKDEDELEKDYLEMDDEPLQPQSPLGKLIAKEFEQPIGEPTGGDEDEPDQEPTNDKEPVQEDYQGNDQTVTDKDGNPLDVDEDAFETAQKTEPTEVQQMDEPFTVQTKEGPAEGKAGDYLAKGVDGEEWPIDQAIFDKTHEFVDPEIQTGLVAQVKEAAEPTDKRGGYYIKTYKGWHIFGLPGYSTPYYYAQGHSSNNDRSIRRIQNFITKKLKAMGKETLDESGVRKKFARKEIEKEGSRSGSYGGRSPIDDQPFGPFDGTKGNGPGSNSGAGTTGGPSEDFEDLDFFGVKPDINDGKNMPLPTKWQPQNWKNPTPAQTHDRFLRDPVFRAEVESSWRAFKVGNRGAKKRAAKFLKANGLLEAGLKRTSGSTEWGKTRKKGKMSSGNLRRSATKRARRAGKKQAQQDETKKHSGVRVHPPKQANLGKMREASQAGRGKIVQVRADLWASTNIIGEMRHFTSRKIAVMFANTKRNDVTPPGGPRRLRGEAVGGKWVSSTNHFKPEGDHEAKTMARGMVQVEDGGHQSFDDTSPSLSPEEMKVIDTNWKTILKVAATLFKKHPHPVALRAIEKYLEKLGVDESHSMKIGEILAKQLNRDTDPTTMIIPKVIPKIQQEPYMRGSGYTAGGSGGLGPAR